jgi:hypothetical protein
MTTGEVRRSQCKGRETPSRRAFHASQIQAGSVPSPDRYSVEFVSSTTAWMRFCLVSGLLALLSQKR